MDRLTRKRFALQVCGGQTLPHRFFPPDPDDRVDLSLQSSHALPRAAGHTCSVTASPAAVWSVFMSSARHLEISLSLVLTALQSDVHFVPLRFDWRLSHFTRSGVFGRAAPSAAAAPTPLSTLLHSPLPPLPLFCSWESDFSLPCHCYSLAKPFKALKHFPRDTVSFYLLSLSDYLLGFDWWEDFFFFSWLFKLWCCCAFGYKVVISLNEDTVGGRNY